jgi:nicotinamide-nucleotide amidase
MTAARQRAPAPALEWQVGERLRARGWTLALAESCTGGWIGHRVTRVPGCSAWFLGGVVAYANRAKTRLLGVRTGMLDAAGAVSEDVAVAMAAGARRVFEADVGLGITGVLGPGGGTPAKPVGLVYVAVTGPRGPVVKRMRNKGQRGELKTRSGAGALRLLRDYLA